MQETVTRADPPARTGMRDYERAMTEAIEEAGVLANADQVHFQHWLDCTIIRATYNGKKPDHSGVNLDRLALRDFAASLLPDRQNTLEVNDYDNDLDITDIFLVAFKGKETHPYGRW